ncbi:hypothetical protein EGW08_021538, partial [Elysia chlorotica]
HHRLLMYTKEPPTFKRFHHLNRTELQGTVNWTRAVFKDSTFRAFYGRIVIQKDPPEKDFGEFYLSFENSMCSEYVTEKLFNMYEDVDIIPVVRGGAHYSDFVPKDTFIDANDFQSPEELGRYLKRLSRDKARYTQMLRNKNRYMVARAKSEFHCSVCEALHTRRHVQSVVPDYYRWLVSHCWKPDDL